VRATTAFKRLLDLRGVTVTEVDFQPSNGVWLSWSDDPDGASPGQRHSPALIAA
jgi:hypothetical protein